MYFSANQGDNFSTRKVLMPKFELWLPYIVHGYVFKFQIVFSRGILWKCTYLIMCACQDIYKFRSKSLLWSSLKIKRPKQDSQTYWKNPKAGPVAVGTCVKLVPERGFKMGHMFQNTTLKSGNQTAYHRLIVHIIRCLHYNLDFPLIFFLSDLKQSLFLYYQVTFQICKENYS